MRSYAGPAGELGAARREAAGEPRLAPLFLQMTVRVVRDRAVGDALVARGTAQLIAKRPQMRDDSIHGAEERYAEFGQ